MLSWWTLIRQNEKTTLHVELPICADACEFLAAMNRKEAELCREEEKKSNGTGEST